MNIIEDSLECDLESFLARPLFCFVAQSSDAGPRVSPLWFLWEDATLWTIAQLRGRSYPSRVERYPKSAVAIVDFDARAGRVEHVGMRGEASLEPYDADCAERLLRKYLGGEQAAWPETFRGLDPCEYRLIEFDPDTLVARDQSYPAPTDPDDSGR
ncbi:pyridoxamine 5'-phosphate oxidase family protein [Natronorubrum sp. DTA7]|uniref:pyridoxamine 5'-phosphate oxidase family protein n=1 Tax=Natronorubrum sp. DTA7 TaxID=3447016 RepID=UPI003F87D34E